MSSPAAPPPAHRVPTLTEVIDVEQPAQAAGPREADAVIEEPAVDANRAPLDLPAQADLVRRVMSDLQRQIDVMLEYRVREVLGPLLARAADNVVRDARSELASTLRDVVARAVESEIARLRSR